MIGIDEYGMIGIGLCRNPRLPHRMPMCPAATVPCCALSMPPAEHRARCSWHSSCRRLGAWGALQDAFGVELTCALFGVQLFLTLECSYTIIPTKKKLAAKEEERRKLALEERKTRDREQREAREREARDEALANAVEEMEEVQE